MSARSWLLLLAVMPLAAEVRVGVFSLFQPERLTVRPAPGTVLRITAGARSMYLQPNERAGARSVGNEVDLFAHREQTSARSVAIAGRDGGASEFVLAVPGRIERRFRGTLQIAASAGRLSAVVAMDLETAVGSAVAAEMPAESPMEGLKAMAVLARSYYLGSKGRHRGFDFCDTTHCQFHRSPPEPGSAASRASAETAGLVLSQPAMYTASCGGRTLEASGHTSVECPACLRDAPFWDRKLAHSAAGALLVNRTEAARLAVVRRLGWSAVPGGNFTIRREGDWVVLQGRGEGHGIGLCQRGAVAMAASGSEFRTILSHYLPSLQILQKKH